MDLVKVIRSCCGRRSDAAAGYQRASQQRSWQGMLAGGFLRQLDAGRLSVAMKADDQSPNHTARDLHQHDLTADAAAAVVADAGVTAGETVLEVGSGTGNLTAALLAAGAKVVAQEIDLNRAEIWRQRFAEQIASGHARVLVGDARLSQPVLPARWRIVANPPFNITAPLIRRWFIDGLPAASPPTAVDMLVQAQVAEKIARPAPAATALGSLCQIWGRCRRGNQLARDAVQPASHVPLALLHVRRHADGPQPAEMKRLASLIDQGFGGAQQVRRALAQVVTPAIVKRQAQQHGWSVDSPARALTPDAWRSLAAFLHQVGKIA
ncbi:MAG: hypothetical protein F6K62_23935 [Sphaerospermopsis sp. SIO1G2]|nr:hypothetical protein [Sphaerospermopsis sp. SIO1G2]